MADRPTLVVVGAATRDVDATDPRGWRLGGGVTYSSIAASRLGVEVRAVVGADAMASTASELDVLKGAAVDLRLVPIQRGPVFDNRQTPAGRVQYVDGPSDPIPTGDLPANWRSPSAAILAPVAGELGDDWANAFSAETVVAVGVQGLVRELTAGGAVRALPLTRTALIERAQMLQLSAEDVAGGAPPLGELLGRDQELVVTHGASGALLLRGGAPRYLPPLPAREPIDSTGAGDVFLAAWVAARMLLGEAAAWRSLLVASAAASLSVLRPGIAGVPTHDDICEAIAHMKQSRRWTT